MTRRTAWLLGAAGMMLAACAHSPAAFDGAAPDDPRLGREISPFTPQLVRNDAPELCAPYAAAWERQFRSAGEMNAAAIDLSGMPQDAAFRFPDTDYTGRKDGLSAFQQAVRHDLDGDGENEVLLVAGRDIGWRYLGAAFYVFENEAAFDAVAKAYEARAPIGSSKQGWIDLADAALGGPVAEFGIVPQARLFLKDGALYTVSPETYRPRIADIEIETLRRVWPAENAGPVCEIRVRPPKEDLEAIAATFPFLQALQTMYGEPAAAHMCYGTMGWTGIDPRRLLADIFHRPWAPPEPGGIPREDLPSDDTARQLRAMSWGASDPESWAVYLRLKAAEPEFLDQMTEYYAARFDMTPEGAEDAAQRAWRALMDRVFYARNNDMPLAYLAWEGEAPLVLELGLGAAALAEAALTAPGLLSLPPSPQNRAAPQTAIAAAIHAGIPASRIEPVFLESWAQVRQAGDGHEAAHFAGGILPAVITRPEMLEIVLGAGIDANTPTNYFGKTALMYAAQTGNIETARLLIAAGADVNARTDSHGAGIPFFGCGELARDRRSALMYAAENAGEDLIQLLIEAGADTSAEDTQGNTFSWYLERNGGLTLDARARLLSVGAGRPGRG